MNSKNYRRTSAQSGFWGIFNYLNITRYKKLRFHFSSPLCVANVKNEISANDLGREITF